MVKTSILIKEIIDKFKINLKSFMNNKSDLISYKEFENKLSEILEQSIIEVFGKYRNE